MLEPNNFIQSWEFGGEEKKEVSETMRKLRKKYDNIHKTVKAKQKELDDLKQGLEQAKNDENNIEANNFNQTTGKLQSGNQLESIKREHDFALMLQRTYLHMRHRMQQDLIAT